MYKIFKTVWKDGSILYSSEVSERPTFEDAVKNAYDMAEYWSRFQQEAEVKKTPNGAQVNYTNGNEHCSAIYEVFKNQ